ncbi:MAG TPA: hypothetical protein VGP47_07455 [Parachlamydiaceae bacterium]|nr:hypothetical protein [Parachlamydiaceae bacterium]
MSANLTISPITPVIWNESMILENGMKFLGQKKDELQIYEDLWNASMGSEYYGASSKSSAEKFKAVAEKSRNEIKDFDNAVTHLLLIEAAKDPSSEKTKQLAKITMVSHTALNYFKSVVNDAYYPTFLNQVPNVAKLACDKIVPGLATLSLFAFAANAMTNHALDSYEPILFKVTLTACIAFKAISYLNGGYGIDQAKEQVKNMKNLFEKALSPEKAVA